MSLTPDPNAPLCNEVFEIALPIAVAVLGTCLFFTAGYAIYIRRQYSKCIKHRRTLDAEKGKSNRRSHHPHISDPILIQGASGESMPGLVPITVISEPRQAPQAGQSAPTTMSKPLAVGPACPGLSFHDKIRVSIGLKPRCPCRNCQDNPRVNYGRGATQHIAYANTRGIEIIVPPPNEKEEVLPIYLRNDHNDLPGYPAKRVSSASEYSDRSSMNKPMPMPLQAGSPFPIHPSHQRETPRQTSRHAPRQPQSQQVSAVSSRSSSPSQRLLARPHPSPPLPALPNEAMRSPAMVSPIERGMPTAHFKSPSSGSQRSMSSMRTPGLPQSPRPTHRTQLSEGLVPRMPRDLVSVGLQVDAHEAEAVGLGVDIQTSPKFNAH
ncbi:MAG: hypothetical protein MMC33_003138 [Icmadophila ericetorum]|nr:hypothetical protein [Icmadophila ericetorum]